MPSSDVIPSTFTTSLPSDRLALIDAVSENTGEAWVVKPPSSNQGKGIFITADHSVIKQLASRKSATAASAAETAADAINTAALSDSVALDTACRPQILAPISKSYEIVQRYISNPMLLPQQKKFDLRVFLLWAKTEPTVVFFHPGYARVCIDSWQPVAADGLEVNKFAHMTNLAVAKV
jgi:hypothetical protein